MKAAVGDRWSLSMPEWHLEAEVWLDHRTENDHDVWMWRVSNSDKSGLRTDWAKNFRAACNEAREHLFAKVAVNRNINGTRLKMPRFQKQKVPQ